jgi:hypothetical protein
MDDERRRVPPVLLENVGIGFNWKALVCHPSKAENFNYHMAEFAQLAI